MTHKLFLYLTILICVHAASAQEVTYSVKDMKVPLGAKVSMAEIPDVPEAKLLLLKAAPAPLNTFQQTKLNLDKQRALHVNQSNLQKKGAAVAPLVSRGFMANVTQGTPNDNDVAISNGGFVISCVNTNMNIYNDTGRLIMGKMLNVLGQKLGTLNRTYDPRVIYDPEADRFIVVFLQGSSSADTRIIIAFSASNDPTKNWNLYQVPGNITGDSSWSDYPIIALSKSELFVTVNRLKDNTFWKNGFLESYIWQIDKAKGYAGDTLVQRVYNNIGYMGKPVWSICPAKGGSKLYGPDMYFLSHRPSDLNNDTVFVHCINNTIASGQATLTTKVLKNPVPYGLQPNAIQPSGKKLQTNDARVLSAMYEGGVIYYTGNTIDQTTFSPGIYFGRVHDFWSTPRLEGNIISSDTMDYGYPSISYVGSGQNGDHSGMITFSHVSSKHYPGTSVVYFDRYFNISTPVMVKAGEGSVNVLLDSVERWGDYTGNQRKYNELGVAWINGSYGNTSGQNRTWVARIVTQDPLSGVSEKINEDRQFKAYPNPAREEMQFEFVSERKFLANVDLSSIDGKYSQSLLVDWVKAGQNQLKLDVSNLKDGIYFVTIRDHETKLHTYRIVVQH